MLRGPYRIKLRISCIQSMYSALWTLYLASSHFFKLFFFSPAFHVLIKSLLNIDMNEYVQSDSMPTVQIMFVLRLLNLPKNLSLLASHIDLDAVSVLCPGPSPDCQCWKGENISNDSLRSISPILSLYLRHHHKILNTWEVQGRHANHRPTSNCPLSPSPWVFLAEHNQHIILEKEQTPKVGRLPENPETASLCLGGSRSSAPS